MCVASKFFVKQLRGCVSFLYFFLSFSDWEKPFWRKLYLTSSHVFICWLLESGKEKKVNQSPWETCDLILKFFFPPKSQVFSLFYYQEKLNSDTLMYIFHLYVMLWWGQNFAVLLSKPNMVMIKTSIVVIRAFILLH